jgi:hypothetical protein
MPSMQEFDLFVIGARPSVDRGYARRIDRAKLLTARGIWSIFGTSPLISSTILMLSTGVIAEPTTAHSRFLSHETKRLDSPGHDVPRVTNDGSQLNWRHSCRIELSGPSHGVFQPSLLNPIASVFCLFLFAVCEITLEMRVTRQVNEALLVDSNSPCPVDFLHVLV